MADEFTEALVKAFYDCQESGIDAELLAVARVALDRAAAAQPCTAEKPNESAYERGRFDGIMEYGRAIRALKALTAPSQTTAPCPPQAPETGPASPADGRTPRT